MFVFNTILTNTLLPPETRYEHAAEAARLETHVLSPLEMERFPQYAAGPHLAHYLRCRNRIVRIEI